jgi:hypothetical protein
LILFGLITTPVFAFTKTIDSTYDLVYHRISITVNPGASAGINNGIVTSYFKTKIPDFTNIQFDLDYSRMIVSSVNYHGTSVSFSKIAPNTISITIPAITITNTLDSISVYYSGTPLIASTSGVPSGYNYQLHNGQYAIYTLGEAFTGHNWWPCKESLFDKIDSVDLVVTAPNTYKVAGNGTVSEVTTGSNIITTWKTRYAIATYGINFAVANYQNYQYSITVAGKTLSLLNYFYAENFSSYKAYADSLKRLIPAYSNILNVEYPFINEKYGFAECAGGNWGALEVQSMTFIATQSFTDSGYTMAHELAHQWFGDMVTTNSWHQIWLNEGFAQYFQQIIYPENIKPASLNYQRSVLKGKVTTSSTVYVPDTSNANTIFIPANTVAQPYEKGAMLVSMLRTWLGDASFFTALHNYLTAPETQYNFTSVDILKKYMQDQTPLDLSNFFNDWVYKNGYVNYTVKWSAAGKKITFQLNQSPTSSGMGYFDMAVPIRIRNTTTGFDTTVIIIDKRGTLYYSGSVPGPGNNLIAFNLSSVPDNISFDPHNTVMAKATGIINDNTILAMKKLLFQAQNINDNKIKLKWSISSDDEVRTVVLEKSLTGSVFNGIFTKVIEEQNNKNISGEYLDGQIASKQFYRLKIIEDNNEISYSNVETIVSEERLSIEVFPNPATDHFNISIPANYNTGRINISIRNMSGRTIQEINNSRLVNSTISLSSRDWMPGMYIITIINNHNIMEKTLMKL